MTTKSKPAVGYIRMSSDQQQDSPARQRKDIQALADRSGYRILRWYEDHGLTGTESNNRKDFQKLLRDDLGVSGVIPLTDDDIRSPGRWREAARFVRQRDDVVYVSETGYVR